LLNVCLTVREGKPNSHKSHGWENFTDEAIKQISRQRSGVVFLLWGGPAQKKRDLINASKHKILTSAHPSPLSVKGFLGCKHFSQTNEYLIQHGYTSVDWCFPETKKKTEQTTKVSGEKREQDKKKLKNKEIKEIRLLDLSGEDGIEEKEKTKEEECNISADESDITSALETPKKRSSTNNNHQENDESTVSDDECINNASKGKTDDPKKHSLHRERE